MRDMIDLVKYFNDNTRDRYWKLKQDKYKFYFSKGLLILKTLIEDFEKNPHELNEKYLVSETYRLSLGYAGIGVGTNGIYSGIVTESTLVDGVKTTKDHLLGATDIGRYVHEEFKKCGYDIDYMVNEWLYENLWLWMTIKVTKEEHRKDNIIRNEHNIEDKLLLKHYKKVSPLVV